MYHTTPHERLIVDIILLLYQHTTLTEKLTLVWNLRPVSKSVYIAAQSGTILLLLLLYRHHALHEQVLVPH